MGLEPGCFGISVCHEPASATCRVCPARVACRAKALEEAQRVAQVTGQHSLLKRFLPAKSVARPTQKKAEEVARTLFATGIDLGGLMARGLNPFQHPTKLRYLNIACRHLLEGGFSRTGLEESLCKELGCGRTTAASYTSITVSLLMAHEVIAVAGSHFTLRKETP